MYIDNSTRACDQRQLDEPLSNHFLFTKPLSDALARNGIVTLRLLMMHSAALLRERIRALTHRDIEEIERKIAQAGWYLAKHADRRHVDLVMDLVATLRAASAPVPLSQIMANLGNFSNETWTESEVLRVLAGHPYFQRVVEDKFRFSIPNGEHEEDSPELLEPAEEALQPVLAPLPADYKRSIRLEPLWQEWSTLLSETAKQVITGRFGVEGGTLLTLHEIGEQLGITKERVRQVSEAALRRLRLSPSTAATQRAARDLLASAMHEHNNLLTPEEWNDWLDKYGLWEDASRRPTLLYLFCALFPEYTYLKRYDVATTPPIQEAGIDLLDRVMRQVLRQHGSTGLSADELVYCIRRELQGYLPEPMLSKSFLLKSIDLFSQIKHAPDGRYYYQRKKALRRAEAAVDWAGTRGTRLYEWEARLRTEFPAIAWIGQINLSQQDFIAMCHAIQQEAQEPNYFTKIMEAQPRLVPPAVFVTTMVLSARYSELQPHEAVDEFWTPYLRTVWGVDYSQAFYARCKKRFIEVTPFLESTFGFEFPRTSRGQGEAVTPIFRHALIPSYMQSDFAEWTCKNWRDILSVSSDPNILRAYLLRDKSLDGYSHRLRQFITGKATSDAAISLITNMAAAVSLFLQDRESPTAIAELLSGTPIEQDLWRQIYHQLAGQREGSATIVRSTRPKLTWVWSLDRDEMNLRIQNIVVSADSNLQGIPDRLAWLSSSESDPLHADIEVQVTPWRMKTGERIIHDAVFLEPDGPTKGCILLLTDADEIAEELEVPPQPGGKLHFFRIAQQDTLGVPVELGQVTDGEWLVCAEAPLTIIDELDQAIAPIEVLRVPYPLGRTYHWAARLNLTLPARLMAGEMQVASLDSNRRQEGARLPYVTGTSLIPGLSTWIQPTFATVGVTLHIDGDGERLLKQVTLWIQGQDGWRNQRTLADLYRHGYVELTESGLQINLAECLSSSANFYSIELRDSLRPIYSMPLLFAVVPGLVVQPPAGDCLYTPANLPVAFLSGVDESNIVCNKRQVTIFRSESGVAVTWRDLRHELHLSLRFGNASISLGWSVPRLTAWLDPEQTQPFITLEQLQHSTLHVAGAGAALDSVAISIPNQPSRHILLQRGRYSGCIGQTQVYDMVRYARAHRIPITIEVGEQQWPLAEVHKRPELRHVHLQHDRSARVISLTTGLEDEWPGKARFLAESLINPFAPIVELGRSDVLQGLHKLPAELPDGVYQLQIELEGVVLPVAPEHLRFKIGKAADELEKSNQLMDEIRSGELISADMAEDFVLWWAEIAESTVTELTSTTLYQLATVPGPSLRNFTSVHLSKLWPPLASLCNVHYSHWEEQHGLLPARFFVTQPIVLKIAANGSRWIVYPLYWGQFGRSAKGYAYWYLSPVEGTPKQFVYFEWEPSVRNTIVLKAGLPESTPLDWSIAELIDMYSLYYCERCGKLCGAPSISLPDDVLCKHRHGSGASILKPIDVPEEFGGYELRAEWYVDRNSDSLVELNARYGVVEPSAADYLPEPPVLSDDQRQVIDRHELFTVLVRNLKALGESSDEQSPLAGAARLLEYWHANGEVSSYGQGAFALSVLLRFAAARRGAFSGLRKSLQISENEIRNALAVLHTSTPQHLEWGMAWAELVMTHSLSTRE